MAKGAVAGEFGARGPAATWERYGRYLAEKPELVLEWRDPETDARGWLVVNSLRGGAAGGGTRMRPGLGRDEVAYLAKVMELKFALAGPPIGGAKSGIDFDPADPRKRDVLSRWFGAIAPELAARCGTAGDLNVDESLDVVPLCREHGIGHPQEGVLRGHLGLCGEPLAQRLAALHEGVETRVEGAYGVAGLDLRLLNLVTGYSVAEAAGRLLERQGREPAETRVLVEGFGSVGGAAALYLARLGARVVGIADARGAVVREEGLEAAEVEALLRRRREKTLPAEPGKEREEAAELRRRFYRTPADVFVAAAASETLDDAALERLEAAGVRAIVSGANHPFRAAAPGDARLARQADAHFAVVADIIANCGAAHAFACQIGSDRALAAEEIFECIRGTVRETLDEAIGRAGSEERGLLAGALEVAMERRAGGG